MFNPTIAQVKMKDSDYGTWYNQISLDIFMYKVSHSLPGLLWRYTSREFGYIRMKYWTP